MDAKTLAALNGSTKTWERRAKGEDIETTASNCPLCKIFHPMYRKDEGISCSGCPVMEETEQSFCEGTPYYDFLALPVDNAPARMAAAQWEVDFLKSLVPE